MRSRFLLFPAAVVASAPAYAENFLTIAEAQELLFPGATFTSQEITMDIAQVAALMKASDTTVLSYKVRAWKASTGGWFFLDQVWGRDDRITYAVGLDENGAVKGIEILVCLSEYAGIRRPEWKAQFHGKSHGKSNIMYDLINISGTTLSSEHIAEGLKRVLATYALFFAPKTG